VFFDDSGLFVLPSPGGWWEANAPESMGVRVNLRRNLHPPGPWKICVEPSFPRLVEALHGGKWRLPSSAAAPSLLLVHRRGFNPLPPNGRRVPAASASPAPVFCTAAPSVCFGRFRCYESWWTSTAGAAAAAASHCGF